MMRLGRWVKWKDGPSPPAAVFDDYVDDEAESGYWDRAESEDHMQWNSGGLTGPTCNGLILRIATSLDGG